MMQNLLWYPGMTMIESEKVVILAAFRHFRGNKAATADALGISVRTLDNKLEKYHGKKAENYEIDKRVNRKRKEQSA